MTLVDDRTGPAEDEPLIMHSMRPKALLTLPLTTRSEVLGTQPAARSLAGETTASRHNDPIAERHRSNLNLGRHLASLITPEQRDAIYREHGQLAMKAAVGEATEEEHNKLLKLRWELDRIEDAEFGPGLDVLEAFISSQQGLAEQVAQLVATLGNRQPRRGKSGTKRK